MKFEYKKIFSRLLLISLFSVAALQTQAVPIFFNDRSAFSAAAGGGLSLESFENSFAVSGTQVFSDFTVSETNGINALGQLRDFPSLGVSSAIVDGTGGLVYDDNGSSIATFFSFTGPVNAFGIEIATSTNSTVTLGGDINTSINLLAGVNAFIGVIDTSTLFNSITFNASGGPNVGFDAALYGVAVPLPGTLALLAIGLAGLGLTRRKS